MRYSEIFVKKSAIFHTPLYSTPPLGGFRSEYLHPLWYGKTIMVSLFDCEKISKISLFVLAQLTNVTDGQTDRHRVTAYTVLMHMHRAVTTAKCLHVLSHITVKLMHLELDTNVLYQ